MMEKRHFNSASEAWRNRQKEEDFVAILPSGEEIVIFSYLKCCFCGQFWAPSVHDKYTCAYCGAS